MSTIEAAKLKFPKRNSQQDNDLLIASGEGDVTQIAAAIDAGANVLEARDLRGRMALDIAGDAGHKNAFYFLVTETAKARALSRARKEKAPPTEIEMIKQRFARR